MVFPFVHLVAVGASILYDLHLTVLGSNMSPKVFRIKERRVTEPTLVAVHLVGVVDDPVMTVVIRCISSVTRIPARDAGDVRYLLEVGLVLAWLAASVALETWPLDYGCYGVCQVLQLALSSGRAAGNIRRRAITEEVGGGSNGSLRLSGRLGMCRALARSGDLSPNSCWRLCTLSNFILCYTAISCAWTCETRFLSVL